MVVQVAATDADDPTYGNSARVVYSIIHGQPYFSVEPKTGGSTQTPPHCPLGVGCSTTPERTPAFMNSPLLPSL